MPIQLNFTDPDTGIMIGTSYWFIIEVDIDRILNIVKLSFGAYNNLAAKNAGKRPFRFKDYTTSFTQLGISGTSTLNQLTNAIEVFALADSFFAGGTQV